MSFLRNVLSLLGFSVLTPAFAQSIFADLRTGAVIPWDEVETYSFATGDVDGDGDVDVIKGILGQDLLYLNDGTGLFAVAPSGSLPPDLGLSSAMVLADFDGDGDLDLVVADQGRQNRFYANSGNGSFRDETSARFPLVDDATDDVEAVDVDADGDLDLCFAGRAQVLKLYRNNGGGFFQDVTGTQLPAGTPFLHAVELGDFDGDGDPDLLGTGDGALLAFENLGGGVFVDGSAARLPGFMWPGRALGVGDLNGDGALDMVVGAEDAIPRLYLNQGNGSFRDASGSSSWVPSFFATRIQDLALGDLDRDGDLDIVFGSRGFMTLFGLAPGKNWVLENDGRASFRDASVAWLPWNEEEPTEAVALADLDGDLDLDLLVGNIESRFDYVRLNDGRGVLQRGSRLRVSHTYKGGPDLDLGDIDGDGDLDCIAAHSRGTNRPTRVGNTLYLNDGPGFFQADFEGAFFPLFPQTQANGAEFADVDGDGDLDLAFATTYQTLLYLNSGRGNFTEVTAARLPRDRFASGSIESADVDGDRDLDFVLANSRSGGAQDAQNQLLLNDGNGFFQDVSLLAMPLDDGGSYDVAVGDLNGDGFVDLLFANALAPYQQNLLYFNRDGSGRFEDVTASHLPVDADASFVVTLGDVDADGDLDAVFGNDRTPDRLYLNDGRGRFADASSGRIPSAAFDTRAVELFDIDEDGDLDLFLGRENGPSLLLANDGRGFFTDVSAQFLPTLLPRVLAAAAADVDGDGDQDLFLSTLGEPDVLLVNLRRQISAPFLAARGHSIRIDVHAMAYGASPAQSMLWVGVRRSAGPLLLAGLGLLFLEPSSMQPLISLTHRANLTAESVALIVPRDPAIAGLTATFQPAILHSPNPQHWRWGGPLDQVVLR